MAISRTSNSEINFVEAGVCDGLTASYALSALSKDNKKKMIYLYDSWQEMRTTDLTKSEMGAAGKYSYLSLERTQNNLKDYKNSSQFIKGYIPEIFSKQPGPDKVSWIHIDLNSSLPTQKTLEHFFPRLISGGIVLFDDYGHNGYIDSRLVIDQFFVECEGFLMPLPTGQAIFFKH